MSTMTEDEARSDWAGLVHRAAQEPVVITTEKRRRFVVLAYDTFERLKGGDVSELDSNSDEIIAALPRLRDPYPDAVEDDVVID